MFSSFLSQNIDWNLQMMMSFAIFLWRQFAASNIHLNYGVCVCVCVLRVLRVNNLSDFNFIKILSFWRHFSSNNIENTPKLKKSKVSQYDIIFFSRLFIYWHRCSLQRIVMMVVAVRVSSRELSLAYRCVDAKHNETRQALERF